MKLETYEHSQNYTAQVIELPVKQPVQGLDNLVRVTVFGNDCLVGKDSPEDQLYLFFPAGSQLSHDFLALNCLYRELQLNNCEWCGNNTGFFEPHRRVKSIKFKGIISTGFVIPVGSLIPVLDTDKNLGLKPGDSFNEIDGVEICRKYIVPTTAQPGPKGDKANKINLRLANLLVPNQFRFHTETSHLANNLDKLDIDQIIVITDKWHGSSCILSKVLVAKKLTFYQKLLNKLGGKIPNKEYGYIYSSGKPKSNLPKGIEGSWINDGPDFYLSNIWKNTFDKWKDAIEDGITIYGEIVGFTKEGAAIQKGYDYGCSPTTNFPSIEEQLGMSCEEQKLALSKVVGESKFVVYRITYTKPDGSVIEFSWQQIKEYCAKYGLQYVKELFYGGINELLNMMTVGWDGDDEGEVLENLLIRLQGAFNLEQDCKYCINKVPAEGIVLRIDGKPTYSAYKLKSKLFMKKESDDLDKGETNIEDNA